MKNLKTLVIVALLLTVIYMATDKWDFGQNKANAGNVYPPSVDFKVSVKSILDETYPNLVKKIVAGTNISISPTGGTEDVTITNTFDAKRVGTITSSATPTPNCDTQDIFTVTALAINATIAAPTGTPANGQKLIIRIKDDNTQRTLAWNAIYRQIGVTLPANTGPTTFGKTTYVGVIYNSQSNTWDVIAVSQEAAG